GRPAPPAPRLRAAAHSRTWAPRAPDWRPPGRTAPGTWRADRRNRPAWPAGSALVAPDPKQLRPTPRRTRLVRPRPPQPRMPPPAGRPRPRGALPAEADPAPPPVRPRGHGQARSPDAYPAESAPSALAAAAAARPGATTTCRSRKGPSTAATTSRPVA